MTKANIYLRVSTPDKQEFKSQLTIINEYLAKTEYKRGKDFREKVTGNTSYLDRTLKLAIKQSDLLIVSEISRLTRKGFRELFEIDTYARNNDCTLVVVKPTTIILGKQLDSSDSLESEVNGFFVLALSITAKLERSMLRDRIKAGMRASKAKGNKLGRKEGAILLTDEEKRLIGHYVSKGLNNSAIAQLVDKHPTSVAKYVRLRVWEDKTQRQKIKEVEATYHAFNFDEKHQKNSEVANSK